ncbi:response regulator transcription factor [Candidatus Woesebacteria bacterium]|nr:response regulator transcription factor [Candidatus Woesebacteria bacterium]
MRILVIEDEVKLATAVKKALTLQSYAVDTVHDGEEGFDLAVMEEYDCIISDIMLPSMDGVELCKKLREEGIKTPILLLTAKGELEDKTVGLDIGADDYMTKPFSFEELFARVRALIRRRYDTTQLVLSVDNLTLNTATKQVLSNGESISLSVKEFAILEYLLQNKGVPVSKETIIQHVWEYDTDTLPSTVEVHIKNIRAKIDTPSQTSLIITIRGVGYMIEEAKG